MALPDAIVGPELYKLGYVTNDRERAIEYFTNRLGFEEFVSFEPAFEARAADGRQAPARLRCAFSAGRRNMVEVLQPEEGLVDLWADPIKHADGFALAFHHFGLVTDNLEGVKKSFADVGIEPTLSASMPAGIAFAYFELPGLGQYVEHIEYQGDTGAFLESVRTRPLAR